MKTKSEVNTSSLKQKTRNNTTSHHQHNNNTNQVSEHGHHSTVADRFKHFSENPSSNGGCQTSTHQKVSG